MKGALHTCQDQEVLNTLSHGVLKEPQILPDSVGCALEPLLLERALAGCKHLLTATQEFRFTYISDDQYYYTLLLRIEARRACR